MIDEFFLPREQGLEGRPARHIRFQGGRTPPPIALYFDNSGMDREKMLSCLNRNQKGINNGPTI